MTEEPASHFEIATRMAINKILDVVAPEWRVIDVTFTDDTVTISAQNGEGVWLKAEDAILETD